MFHFYTFLKQSYIHLCSCGAEAPPALPGHCRAAASDRYHHGIVTGLYLVVFFCVFRVLSATFGKSAGQRIIFSVLMCSN